MSGAVQAECRTPNRKARDARIAELESALRTVAALRNKGNLNPTIDAMAATADGALNPRANKRSRRPLEPEEIIPLSDDLPLDGDFPDAEGEA